MYITAFYCGIEMFFQSSTVKFLWTLKKKCFCSILFFLIDCSKILFLHIEKSRKKLLNWFIKRCAPFKLNKTFHYWTSLMSEMSVILQHSVESLWFFYHLKFTWNQFTAILVTLNFVNLGKFRTYESAKIHRNENSGHQNVLKCQIL